MPVKANSDVPRIFLTREQFLASPQGKTYSDVVNDPEQPFATVLDFFNDIHRQRRMEEAELHHDRAPLAGVVLELESIPTIDSFFNGLHTNRSTRLRQAIGVIVRMIMERKGWRTTGRKGSLGVRANPTARTPHHNSGGLAFWFIRAERYQLVEGMPYRTARTRCTALKENDHSADGKMTRRVKPPIKPATKPVREK